MDKPANPHLGSTFEDFLKEEGVADVVHEAAVAQVLAWQIAEEMKARLTR